MAGGRNSLIVALDVGTTKTCCFVARRDGAGGARVIGIGYQASKGLKTGAVIDMDAAEEAIRGAVHTAENMAGETVHQVIVNLSGGRPTSHTVSVDVDIAGRPVGDMDVRRVLSQARAAGRVDGGALLHAMPTGYAIDGNRGVPNPRGMHGDRLGVDMHFVYAEKGAIRNLSTVIQRCHLEVSEIIVSPRAAAEATLVEDEIDLGVTLIDMGGGTTSIAAFSGGNLIHLDVIPVGGLHVTNDIALGLSTSPRDAERIKTLYGSAIACPTDDRETLSVPQLGESGCDASVDVPRAMLTGIIQPRIEETLELVRERLEASGCARAAGRRAVLTGGASQLTGVRELAAKVLGKQVRTGKPIGIHGLAEATEGPAFATCAGLLAHAVNGHEGRRLSDGESAMAGGRLARFGRWLKENF